MNTFTVRSLFKHGYSLCAKDLFIHPSTSRTFCNYAVDRNLTTPWQKRYHQRETRPLPSLELKHWNINSTFIACDFQYFSTSIPHNSQTALKPKSPDRDSEKKPQSKTNVKSVVDEQVENQTQVQAQTENVTEKTETVPQTEEKLSIFQKFKKMYKEYWYVLLPVHCVTSVFWFGSFYYLSTRYTI